MNRGRFAKRICIVGALLLLVSAGCSDPPKLSEAGYGLARALYTVCNLQSPEQLTKFEDLLAEEQVGDAERQEFTAIVGVAKSGDWHAAQERTRELIAAQNIR